MISMEDMEEEHTVGADQCGHDQVSWLYVARHACIPYNVTSTQLVGLGPKGTAEFPNASQLIPKAISGYWCNLDLGKAKHQMQDDRLR